MKRFTAIVSMLLLVCMILGSCGGATGGEVTTDKINQSEEQTTLESTEKNVEDTTEEKSENRSERGTEDMTTEDNKTEEITTEETTTEEVTTEEITTEEVTTEEATTEEVTTEETTTEEVTTEAVTELFYAPEIESAQAAMPDSEAAKLTYECGDGAILERYDEKSADDFWSACAYLKNEGFEKYSLNRVGTSLSAIYTKGDAYYSLLFSEIESKLYITRSEEGALNFPVQGGEYEVICESTVTQGYSKNINGMTYIFRLADGSFIISDGGYVADANNLYKTLCKLSGKEEGIHIRAWLMSHSHNDHYPAFGEFGRNYGDKVKLDSFMYLPIPADIASDKYLNDNVQADIALYEGAKAVTVHAGMVFKFADVTLEVLNTPDFIYSDNSHHDFNESSVVFRVKNEEGGLILLGDCYSAVSNFLINTYGEALQTDMMQVSHHGVEQATIELYDLIAPKLAFWPCDEWLLCHERGTTTKQYLLSNENIYEHVIHGYGNATRPLSYKAEPKETMQVISDSLDVMGSANVSNIRYEDNAWKFDIVEAESGKMDPFVYFKTPKINTEEYNAVRIVIKVKNYKSFSDSSFFFTCGSESAYAFSTKRVKTLGPQGVSRDGVHTLILYLGNTSQYRGYIKALRLDVGNEVGQTVEIRSVEFFNLDID